MITEAWQLDNRTVGYKFDNMGSLCETLTQGTIRRRKSESFETAWKRNFGKWWELVDVYTSSEVNAYGNHVTVYRFETTWERKNVNGYSV